MRPHQINRDKNKNHFLEIKVNSSKCYGMNYNLALIIPLKSTCNIYNSHKASVILDKTLVSFLQRAMLDFKEILGQPFSFIKNFQLQSCSCGDLFGINESYQYVA